MWGHIIIAASDGLYELVNRLAGHFWLFDNLLALSLHNQLVKAAILGGCFLAAWHAQGDEHSRVRARRILLITIIASGLVVAVTKAISTRIFHPRPFIYSQQTYHLDGESLVPGRHLSYRVPLDSASQKKYHQLAQGELDTGDLDAFPSDHAAFYATIAAGIMLASPIIGRFAVAWTILVIIAGRVITGQHSPLDVVAGAAIGILILTGCQTVVSVALRRIADAAARWTLRHEAITTAIVFVALFEISNTLQDLNSLIDTGAAIARYFRVG